MFSKVRYDVALVIRSRPGGDLPRDRDFYPAHRSAFGAFGDGDPEDARRDEDRPGARHTGDPGGH